MKYGDRLKKLRKEKKLSQQELAEKLEINRSTYARYETSTTQPDYETLHRLADFFDVTIDYILGRTNNPKGIVQNDEYDPLEDLKQFLIDNNLQDMNLSFFNIEDWKKLNKDDIEEIKRHFEWVVEKAKQREKEDE